jgi:GNAT superfamily N-acetyltransferase
VEGVDRETVAIWCAAWARSRGVAPPIAVEGAFHIAVRAPEQQARYVFPTLDPRPFRALAESIREPRLFLKVCAPPAAVLPLLPPRWRLDQPRFMMAADLARLPGEASLPAGYVLSVREEAWGFRAAVLDAGGAEAARGGLVIEQGRAIFDRIVTEEAHRHRGLARAVMACLEAVAVEQGAGHGVLVATGPGHALYTRLGWRTLSDYTSAVIPA